MSDYGSLSLHTLVWDDNIDGLVAALMTSPPLETLDAHGNTPLLLAYRMGRVRAARMLLAAGAFSKARAPGGWEAVQVAALSANPDLARTAVTAFLAETDAAFARRLPALAERLAAMPDFTMRLDWKFESWVPLVSSLLPSDTYSIYKRGSSLRLDTTLLGMSGLRWERGSVSLMLWGPEMPVPGAMYVMDNEAKTAADARLAFTHPRDVHIQDWVRKLLTATQKTTDYWSRDVVMAPVLKQGLLGGFFSQAKALVGAAPSVPRGRVSAGAEGASQEGATAAAADGSSTSVGSAGSASGTPTPAPLVHVDDPRQVHSDVGGWGPCAAYTMANLCIRDTTHAPVLPGGLKLRDWWRPEYSTETTVERQREEEGAAAAARGAASAVADAEAPELLLKPLQRALNAIRIGRQPNGASPASGAAAAVASARTLEELEAAAAAGDEDGAGGAWFTGTAAAAVSRREVAFEAYFGVQRPLATAEQAAAAAAAKEARAARGAAGAAAGAGEAAEAAADSEAAGAEPSPRPWAHYVAADGHLHRPRCLVSAVESGGRASDKEYDIKVFFAKNFPITTAQFLPVAEVMARSSAHAANFTRFFESKMPQGAGFPVRFSIPVFPTITATVTFELCDTRRAPPAAYFELRKDYAMGAYVEKGFIRQM